MNLNKLDRSNTSQAHSQTGTYARGYYGISILILWGEKCYKFIHEMQTKTELKNKTQKKYHSKTIQNAQFYTPRMSDSTHTKHAIYAYGFVG